MKSYRTRQERLAFLQANFGGYLNGRILDVGCDQAHLRPHIGRERYLGIDLSGDYDVQVNLESGVLPLAGGRFDCVICLDVLEHLEQIHAVFGELVRVSRHYIIISLPNPFAQYWPLFLKGGGRADKYGLPAEPPPDRHRWFFNYQEAKAFLLQMAERHQAQVVQIMPIPLVEESIFWKSWLKQLIRRLTAPSPDKYLNLSTQAIWAVLEKES